MGGFIGQDVPRVDGPAKVSGSAQYCGEITLPVAWISTAQGLGCRLRAVRTVAAIARESMP